MAAICFGLNPVFAKLAYSGGLDAVSALVFRFLVPALLLVPFLTPSDILKKSAVIAVLIGAVMGFGMLCYFWALEDLPLPTAALIYFTYPVFTAIYGVALFHQSVSWKGIVAIGLVLGACLFIFAPTIGNGIAVRPVLLCFVAPASFALLLHALVIWIQDLPPPSRAGFLIIGHVLVLVPFLIVRDDLALVPTNAAGWIGVLGLASVASLIPQILMAVGTPLIGAERTSIVGAFELITAILVGWAVVGDAITPMSLVGMMMICLALYVSAGAK